MNKYTLGVLALVALCASVTLGQTAAIDRTFQVYSMSAYHDTTHTDTTQYYSLWDRSKGLATNLAVQIVANDSTSVEVKYQLKNSVTGLTSSFTLLGDTITFTKTGTTDTAVSVANLALTTILGYDLIRFRHDYLTGNGFVNTAGKLLKEYVQFSK